MAALPKAVSSRERAAALIIVLALVVLLTGLVVAYLSRAMSDRPVAHGSFNQSRADQIAASAMDLVIGALRQEITGPSPTPTPPYFPLPNANMLPLRFGNPGGLPDPIPNLVRRSVQGDGPSGANPIPSPGMPSLASAVNSTADISANGRSITSTRWNSHYLVPKKNTTDDSLPVDAFNSATPDWVILTRGGPVAFSAWSPTLADQTATNSSYAVGRYAYAIYDEGGLLDANVAGYPSNTTAAQYGPKGISAFANLTAIGMSQPGIDAVVGWRNYFSASPGQNFPGFNFNAGAATNYVNSVLSNTNGFMAVTVPSPTPNNMSRTDQQFPTRQSLIQLRASIVASIGSAAFPATALEYLTTFSRELNAPSWAPTQDASAMGGNNGAGNIYAYKTNADSGAAINRNLLNVRVTNNNDNNPFIRADGTAFVNGQPLINRRFPLSRINGLGPAGPNTTTNSTIIRGLLQPATTTSDPRYPELPQGGTIQRDFGLQWDNANNRWNYVGGTGATVPAIERLDQVAAENREPNFFELLKAAILSGSVGMGSGSANSFVVAEQKYYITGSTPSNLLSSDYQIMQIGANIIDQWDSDNIPTFIGFGLDPATSQPYEVAGIENLPYLNKLVFKPAWTTIKGKQGNPDTYKFDAWLLPSLWNPHQNAPPVAKQNIQLVMSSGTMTASLEYSGGTLQSTNSISAGSTMAADASASGTSTLAPITGTGSDITKSPDNYYGFYFSFPGPGTTVTPSNSIKAYPDFGAACDFQMKVQVGTAWKAYQTWKGCGPNHPLVCQSPPDWTVSTLQDPEFVTLDPRTLRFGVWGNAGNQTGAVTADYTAGTQGTLDWPAPSARFEHITALPPQGSSFSSPTSPNLYNYANNIDGTVHYTDLDGVQRLGDFIAGATTAMLPTDSADRPLMLNGAFQNGVFQSVAELGHVFRDQPWKTLNFAAANSADSGLLDVFTLHESSMEAGKTSLNTKQPLVLKAILGPGQSTSTSGGAIKRLAGTSADLINSTQRDAIVTALQGLQPMVNKAELVTRLAADPSVTGLGNKEARELVMRAFSDACQTRTWNLMIDVVAQSGRYPPNASTLAGFLVEGEQHYWVHVAIDRFTGQVIDKQIEVVME
jgi:hypothetical protein